LNPARDLSCSRNEATTRLRRQVRAPWRSPHSSSLPQDVNPVLTVLGAPHNSVHRALLARPREGSGRSC
jgi:hypothetical protein